MIKVVTDTMVITTIIEIGLHPILGVIIEVMVEMKIEGELNLFH